MIVYVLNLADGRMIKYWTTDNSKEVVAQLFNNGHKSRKSKYMIREYNGRNYIVVLGHRYYLDSFRKIEI